MSVYLLSDVDITACAISHRTPRELEPEFEYFNNYEISTRYRFIFLEELLKYFEAFKTSWKQRRSCDLTKVYGSICASSHSDI